MRPRKRWDRTTKASALPLARSTTPRIERAVREILLAVGEDPRSRRTARNTRPRRPDVRRAVCRAASRSPAALAEIVHGAGYDEVVLVRDISFQSTCEHHLLPFLGKAHVAYLPGPRIVGLSKLARVVEEIARRPQVQERMTEQIANLLVEELQVKGVAVIIEAEHTCMTIRGVRQARLRCASRPP